MKKCIVVPSVTYAQKALKVLKQNKISASATKRRPGMSKHGCAWCVYVKEADMQRALFLFSSSGVLMTGEIYDV